MNKQLLSSILVEQLQSLLTDNEKLVPRDIELGSHLTSKEITIITGVRRCGKSSLVKQVIRNLPRPEDVLYLNFDDPRLLHFEAADFEKLYDIWLEQRDRTVPKIVIFDEIQNVPGWERWMIFFSEQKKFKVFITGSNSKLLSSELGTHLTGRHEDITLYPLSFTEVARVELSSIASKIKAKTALTTEEFSRINSLFSEYFKLGGFPRIWTSKSVALLSEYYTDILNRDIVRRYGLRQPQLIAAFGAGVMSDIGRKFNKSKFARDLGIKEANTVNKYFKFFEECYLGIEIRKFDTSIRRQMRNASKFYAIDPVLAQRVGIASGSKDGFYFENLVLIELLRRGCKVYYWQESDSAEVDFVVETPGRERWLVQSSWTLEDSDTLTRELSGFREFESAFPNVTIHKKIIITVARDLGIKIPAGIEVVPFVVF